MECDRIFCHYGPFFALLLPYGPKKSKILKNWKKLPGDIIILQKCTKNHDHMLYCSVDIAHNRFNCYFSFQAFFLPLYLPNSPKNQNLEKWKKILEISPFYNSVSKIMVICYTVPEILCVADVILYFGPFFALLPPFCPFNCTKNKKF